jgi:3-methyladenine DNA glycosylase Mpg
MPSSPGYKRDYKEEYSNYQGSEKQKKERARRNAARKKMMKAGKAKLGDGMDVAHKNNSTKDNSSKNLAIQSKSKNRSFARNKKAGRKK